jgi:glutamate/tyrosine decarboxylase-like PLP-dependent enzyme
MTQDILIDYYSQPEKDSVVPYHPKAILLEEFRETAPPEQGSGLEATLDFFKNEILPKSIKTWHPLYMNQMFAGVSLPGALGDLFASMMNPTLATWEMSPVATIIERNVSEWLAQLLGMKEGSAGIFLPGGSMSNLLGLTVARNQKLSPESKYQGLFQQKRGAIICSEAAHYSVANSAHLLGLGVDNLIKVKTNHRNEMCPLDLKAKLDYCDANEIYPFAVVATMGLTVTGGFDPLDEIVALCKPRGMHIHVDAAWGGGIALTKDAENHLAKIQEADTVIWDCHKWFHAPLTCTALLVPNVAILKHTFNTGADYLFHPQEEDIPEVDDLGQYTILCGKRFDALKVWMLFNTFGTEHFRHIADSRQEFTRDVWEMLEKDPDFQPSYEPVSPIQCFQFQPTALAEAPQSYRDRLHRWVREVSKKRGIAMYNITKLKGEDHFRMILVNPLTTLEHMRQLLDQIRSLAYEFMEAEPLQAATSSTATAH